jgi:uncharacterized protein YutE (UPF0331/DUF86 family)
MLTWYSEFAHYSINLLALVYPLDRDEYRVRALERRASYAYLTDIIEGASRLAGEMLEVVGAPKQRSDRETFSEAAQRDLLPSTLVAYLHDLKSLRNEVVHQNPRVDRNLVLYPRLGELCVVGFSLYEVFIALAISRAAETDNVAVVVPVDRNYLISALDNAQRYRTRNPDSPSWKSAEISIARRKLHCDGSIPSIVIDQPQIVHVLLEAGTSRTL